jgi:hypothetical protein
VHKSLKLLDIMTCRRIGDPQFKGVSDNCIELQQVPGLGVRVTDTGAKTFVLVVRYPGGSSPSPRAPLEAARIKGREWLAHIASGVDPKVREAARRADTLQAIAETYLERHSHQRTINQRKAILDRLILPSSGPGRSRLFAGARSSPCLTRLRIGAAGPRHSRLWQPCVESSHGTPAGATTSARQSCVGWPVSSQASNSGNER